MVFIPTAPLPVGTSLAVASDKSIRFARWRVGRLHKRLNNISAGRIAEKLE